MTVAEKFRHIRSYVRREGRITPAQQRALDTLWDRYGVETGKGLLDFGVIFGRNVPRKLEIGFGMGESILSMAQSHPENDYIAIDVYKPGIGHLLLELEQRGLDNVRIIQGDAVEILKQVIPDNCFESVYLFFADPWPKKRHHKRRIMQPEFVDMVARKLESGGHFYLATDWKNYAESMMAVLSQTACFKNIAGEGNYSTRIKDRPLTKFEKRGQSLGHEVWDLGFVRV